MHRRGEFRVHVTKDYLVFASAHFITLAGHRCEALHGHNYRVGVTVEGAVDDESWYVIDFGALKRVMRRLCDEIDHKVLLPTEHPDIDVREEGDAVTVAYQGALRYRFPRIDCALLPVPNTTAEMLAELLADRLCADPVVADARGVRWIEVEVEENFGQSAFFRATLG